MFLPIFLSFSNQNFVISILISVCTCLSACLGPYCLGLFSSSLAEIKNVINISMPFTQKIRHFLSWVAYTLNKAKVIGDPGPCENQTWTFVGIAETGRKFEWQEFCITLKVACYFLLYYSYARNQGKLEKKSQTNKPWKISFLISVFLHQPHGQTMENTGMKHRNETGMKGLFILVSSVHFHFSQKHPVCSR